MVKILVVGFFEAGSIYAHAINTVKMAQGFAIGGHDVTVACSEPEDGPIDVGILRERYGLHEALCWRQLPSRSVNGVPGQLYRFLVDGLPLLATESPDLVFARDYLFPVLSSLTGVPTVVESHAHPGTSAPGFRILLAAARLGAIDSWITISDHLADDYHSQGVPPPVLEVLPTGVDLRMFDLGSDSASNPFGQQRPVATYLGHLYDYKGIPTILDAAGDLLDVTWHLVGGWPEDVSRVEETIQRRGLDNVKLHGQIDNQDVPSYLHHSDVLLLPPSAEHPSAEWTSPVKLGEYMASGTPIVTSRIPALEDWLEEDEVTFVEPDDAQALAEGVRSVLEDPARAREKAERAKKKVERWSYEQRAQRILDATLGES